jgi:hypothetical protein
MVKSTHIHRVLNSPSAPESLKRIYRKKLRNSGALGDMATARSNALKDVARRDHAPIARQISQKKPEVLSHLRDQKAIDEFQVFWQQICDIKSQGSDSLYKPGYKVMITRPRNPLKLSNFYADLHDQDKRKKTYDFKLVKFLEDNNITLQNGILSQADLRGADLRQANLEVADLSGADLKVADLSGADLKGADLRGANLVRACLVGAKLEGAKLEGAELRNAGLVYADLRGADLRGANLKGANLIGANLKGADLRGADLRGANLKGANLDDIIKNSDTIFGWFPLTS